MIRVLHLFDYFGPHGGMHTFFTRQKRALESFDVTQLYLAQTYPPFRLKEESSEYSYDVIGDADYMLKIRSMRPNIVNIHNSVPEEVLNVCVQEYATVRTIHSQGLLCPHSFFKDEPMCHLEFSRECMRHDCITDEAWFAHKRMVHQYKAFKRIFLMSRSMHSKLLNLGFSNQQLVHIDSFIQQPDVFSYTQDYTIVYSGRLIEQKGVHHLLHAVGKLKHIEWKLIVAGSGELPYIRKLAALAKEYEILERVTFTGLLNHESIRQLYAQAYFLVFPSIGPESYGYSGAEAIAHGVPVIAYSVDGVEEWLSNGINGLLVPVGEINKLSEAIKELLVCKDRYAALKKNACSRKSKIKEEALKRELYEAYASMLNN